MTYYFNFIIPYDKLSSKSQCVVSGHAKGLIEPRPEDKVDKASVEYFRKMSQDYADAPDSYSALDAGAFLSYLL